MPTIGTSFATVHAALQGDGHGADSNRGLTAMAIRLATVALEPDPFERRPATSVPGLSCPACPAHYSSPSGGTVASLATTGSPGGRGSPTFVEASYSGIAQGGGPSSLRDAVQMPRELSALHQRLASRKPAVSIGPEIVGRIAVGKLNESPQRPEQVAHRLIENDPPALGGPGLAAEIGPDHRLVPLGVETRLHRQVAEVPHRIVHAGIFPVDDPHAVA